MCILKSKLVFDKYYFRNYIKFVPLMTTFVLCIFNVVNIYQHIFKNVLQTCIVVIYGVHFGSK